MLGTALLAGSTAVQADKGGRLYEVTVTNVTRGQYFTPIMVASTRKGVTLFEVGAEASSELETIAESGDPEPLAAELLSSGDALDVAVADGPLPPGGSLTLTVRMDKRHDNVSVASMLVPTNDAFLALNGVRGPKKNETLTLWSPAYDAGTENNDEACASIPGPPFICTGEGVSMDSGEGFVHVHAGIQGVVGGDLVKADHDWRNPVARIVIRRVKD